jgi:hypothetical protein
LAQGRSSPGAYCVAIWLCISAELACTGSPQRPMMGVLSLEEPENALGAPRLLRLGAET